MHMDHVGGPLADGLRDRLRPDVRVHLAAAKALVYWRHTPDTAWSAWRRAATRWTFAGDAVFPVGFNHPG